MGRREQNKQRTRSALEQAAARLFEEHGFAATTVRDIATAAGVGERTFFRYFPSKEDLVLDQARRLIPELTRRVRARPAAERLNAALLESIVSMLMETGTPPAIFFTGKPEPADRQTGAGHALLMELEEAVTEAFLDRLSDAGADPEDTWVRLRAVVQARAGVSALRAMLIVHPFTDDDFCSPGPAPRSRGDEAAVADAAHVGAARAEARTSAGGGDWDSAVRENGQVAHRGADQGSASTPDAASPWHGRRAQLAQDGTVRPYASPEKVSPAEVAAFVREAFAALAEG